MVVLHHEEIKWIPFLLFQLTQGTVVQFWTPSSLRGYGTGTPNGPLWTISVIVQCYVVLWFLYKVLHQKSVKRWAAIILFFITFNVFRAEVLTSIKPAMAAKVVWYSFPTHLWLFLVGALLREYIDEWKCILAKMWWVFFLAAICVNYFKFDFGSYGVLKGTFLALSAVGFAYAYPQLSIANDYSYGIYLYHMIVINLLVEVGITEGCLPVVLSFTGTIILSVVSYHTLGQLKQHTGKPNKELST